jgi:hypothetical protein
MLERLLGFDSVTLAQCQAIAKKVGGFNKLTFTMVGPKASIDMVWLDAYYGMFQMVGNEDDGFMMASEFQFNNDLKCINLGEGMDLEALELDALKELIGG